MTSLHIPNSVWDSDSIIKNYVTASVASWSIATSSAWCINGVIIAVMFGTN